VATDPKLRLNNITYEASFFYCSEKCIINKKDAQKLEAAQMKFLRPLLGITRLDCHIHNRLKVDNIVEDIK
jgi:hypothetical protein